MNAAHLPPLQASAARSLYNALKRVRDAGLALRVYDGSIWVYPENVELWPNGGNGDPFEVLGEHGADVSVEGLNADGGAGA